MAFEIWEGPPRSGKSYTLVNRLLRGWLLNSKRHIYHNLPLVDDQFLSDLARTSAIREEFRSRLHFLDGKADKEAFDDEGKSLGEHNPVREFWFFCPAGAVIILDEVAEEWTALDRSNRSELLQPVFNRQGHFGWDLVFACQDIRDVDVQIRRKAHFVYTVRNSTKEPILPWSITVGIMWPVQFFVVRQYDGSRYGEKRGGDLLDYFVVWPKARGFRNYKSFTHSVRLGWIKPKTDDQESGDHKTGKARIVEAVKRSKRLILLGVVGVALWFGFWAGLRGLARLADSQKTGNWLFSMTGQTNQTKKVEAVAGPVATNGTGGEVRSAGGVALVPERERVVLVAPSFVRTTKGVYEVGSLVGTNRVRRILLDGFEWEGGGRDKFAGVFK